MDTIKCPKCGNIKNYVLNANSTFAIAYKYDKETDGYDYSLSENSIMAENQKMKCLECGQLISKKEWEKRKDILKPVAEWELEIKGKKVRYKLD